MASVELSPSQEKILRTLIHATDEEDEAVKGETLATEMDRGTGTIRNQMQVLKSMGLAEGIRGPKGGYRPTVLAYKTLDIQKMENPVSVPVTHERTELDSVLVEDITLTNVHHPEQYRAEVYMQNSTQDIDLGDEVLVGPTPIAKLVVTGSVCGKDATKNGLILKISELEAPATL